MDAINANIADFGEPLRIHQLNIENFVRDLANSGVRTTSSKIQALHPRQLEICNDPARFKVVACGRRFGKSLLCALIACAVAMQPGRKIWIVSDTYELADRVFLEIFHILVNELKFIKKGSLGQASSKERYIKLPNGSLIQAKTCEHRETLVGESLDLIIWDECGLTPTGKDIWFQELRPCLTDRKGSAVFISTPRGRNYFFDFYQLGQEALDLRKKINDPFYHLTDEERMKLDWASFKYSSYENTKDKGGYLDAGEIDAARMQTPKLRFKQEYLADFDAVADRAFPGFNQSIHVVDYEYNRKNGPVYASLDFNYATPCTTLYAQIDQDANIMIFDEYWPPEAAVNTHQQAQQLLYMDQQLGQTIDKVVADIAGKQVNPQSGRSSWDDLATWGIYPVGKKQKVEVGCDLVRLWLEYPALNEKNEPVTDENGEIKYYPKLFISRKCKALINALETAKFPMRRQLGVLQEGYVEDGIVDGPLDALRYLLVYLLHDAGQEPRILTAF